ncbi:unnamed protein product [Photorhabdus laumondii subsp. laumondii TTO1]|uniref:Photorhabdus luminescens subsp. laumondii TTO1 complete genome segment 11/17 n=1 Tax=Photorhabdus laumondii subsp. laumondii (strain DSM 15139 / CIP 105565 / TT01) TaxID=243265 RepID=Q7N264_PHOLL|nr:unnamed protein product [Photorhabdus laumondii subsp. laumondii TTO1]
MADNTKLIKVRHVIIVIPGNNLTGISQPVVNRIEDIYTGHSPFRNTSMGEQNERFLNFTIFLTGAYKNQLFFSKKYNF